MDTLWGQCLGFKGLNNYIFKGFQIQQVLKIANIAKNMTKKMGIMDHRLQSVPHQVKKEAKKVKFEFIRNPNYSSY